MGVPCCELGCLHGLDGTGYYRAGANRAQAAFMMRTCELQSELDAKIRQTEVSQSVQKCYK